MSLILLLQWVGILMAALYALVKGSDIFHKGSIQISRALGMNSFMVGILIVGICTSLPLFTFSLAGVLQGSSTIVVASVIGSNITNILLIFGILAYFGGTVSWKLEEFWSRLPIFCIAISLLVMTIIDGQLDRLEALLLLITFAAYIYYLVTEGKNDNLIEEKNDREPFSYISLINAIFGITAVIIGAKFSVDMVTNIATGLEIPVGLISISAVAFGTSLPVLLITLEAIRNKQIEMAVGVILGASVFNALVVTSVPAIISGSLAVDSVVMDLGLVVMIVASVVLIASCFDKQIKRWHGLVMLAFFVFFLLKLSIFI